MMTLVRTIVDVPDEMIRSLDQLSVVEKRSRASLIREAIADYLKLKAVPPAEAAFGLWKETPREGVQYQNDLRGEWENR
jgi:predicted transcriptional regulator